jgi:hypothetical protein
MENMRNEKGIQHFAGIREGKILLEKPGRRWEDNIKVDFKDRV